MTTLIAAVLLLQGGTHTDEERGFSIALPGPGWKIEPNAGDAHALLKHAGSKHFLGIYVTVNDRATDVARSLNELEKWSLDKVKNGRRVARGEILFKPAGRAWELVVCGTTSKGELLHRRYVVFAREGRLFILETVAATGAELTYRKEIASALESFAVLKPKLTHADAARLFSIDRPNAGWEFREEGGVLTILKRKPAVFAGVHVTVVEKGDASKLAENYRVQAKAAFATVKEESSRSRAFEATGDAGVEIAITGLNRKGTEVVRRAFVFAAGANGNVYIVETVAARQDAAACATEFSSILKSFKALKLGGRR